MTTISSTSSPSPTKPSTPPNHNRDRPSFSQRVQNDACFRCGNKGHWAANCPFKTLPPSKSESKSPNSSIPCPYGHGSCSLRISRSKANPGRPYYSCSYSGCEFFKWHDQVVEMDLGSVGGSNSKAKRDRALDSYPDCHCGAGKCKLVQERIDRYFVCPIEKGHGACSFKAAVDDTQRAKTATSDFKEGNEVSYPSPKRTKFDSPAMENPDQISTPVGPCPLIEEIVTENNDHDDILDMSTILEMAMEDEELEDFVTEKSIQVSRLTPEAVHCRQVEFLRQISASEDAICADPIQQLLGTLITGWLGRLAFPPSGCLTVAPAKPFFCCVFPSLDLISVPKGVDTFSHGEINYLPLSHLNAQPDSSLQIPSQDYQSGILLELTSIQNVPGICLGRNFMGQISKALAKLGMHFQKQLLNILESTEPRNHKSMTEAANKTFSVLNQLSVDHRSFSEHVRKYISCSSSLAKLQDSMMGDQSSEVIIERYDNERAKFDKISRMRAETVDAFTASDKRLKSLGEEASHLKEMLLQIEDQLRRCEKEHADLKTQSGKISEDMLEAEKKLHNAEEAKRLHGEREMEMNTAKESLERARIQLRQSVFMV